MALVERPDGLWAEVAPERCPACGHDGRGWALVGTHPCAAPHARHRTHLCKVCDHETFTPPLTVACREARAGFTETSIVVRAGAGVRGAAPSCTSPHLEVPVITASELADELGVTEGDVIVLTEQLGESGPILDHRLAAQVSAILNPHSERSVPQL